MVTQRAPAVAGAFYPADANALREGLHGYLDQARASLPPRRAAPKALIAPHAGYTYSGSVAASAFVLLEGAPGLVARVVLLGPSHHVAFTGLAIPSHAAFDTPLGSVPIDQDARNTLCRLPFVQVRDDAHRWEHCLEVQLPFLQEVLDCFSVLPVAVGQATARQVDEALEVLWGGSETLIVVSSDLSHYHEYATAKRMDAATAAAIESLDPERIGPDDACGRLAVQGLLQAARRHSLVPRRLDLRNSGDTAGSRHEVVGYGAWAFTASKNGAP